MREVEEECGVTPTVGELLLVHDEHFSGTAPSGRYEDFHSVALVFAATVPDDAEPRVVEVGGTTDLVEWVPLREVTDGSRPVLDVVHEALAASAPKLDGEPAPPTPRHPRGARCAPAHRRDRRSPQVT